MRNIEKLLADLHREDPAGDYQVQIVASGLGGPCQGFRAAILDANDPRAPLFDRQGEKQLWTSFHASIELALANLDELCR